MHLNIGQMKATGKWFDTHRRNDALRYSVKGMGLQPDDALEKL